jgi:hypothetical protein
MRAANFRPENPVQIAGRLPETPVQIILRHDALFS